MALGTPAGGWIDHLVYGPQSDGQTVVLIPPPSAPVNRFKLHTEVVDGELVITWEPESGLIFRVLSNRDLSGGEWHEEAVLDTPSGRVIRFSAPMDSAIKFFQVQQIE